MPRLCRALVGSAVALGACARSHPLPDSATPAERTHFLHTATYDETVNLLNVLAHRVHVFDSVGRRDTLHEPRAPMDLLAMDTTVQGRWIPVVILARPMVRNGAQAHASGRPVVYVEASMAAGEVDGKDAMLALVRDLLGRGKPDAPSVLDSVVIVVVPMVNPDGNEARGPVGENRPNQRGPDTVGTDDNAQGFVLNRDFVKAEAPETRSTLDLLRMWDPDVYLELHTADGSYTGFAYNYAPTLHPASLFTGAYARDSILPEVRRRLHDRDSLETFDYGTFTPPRGPGPDTVKGRRWETFDYRPRYGTNYVGLRNRIAILGVSYAHDTFERRIAAQEAFVRQLLSIVAERAAGIRALTAAADSSVRDWALHPNHAPELPLAAQVAQGSPGASILAEDLALTGDSGRTESGVPPGVRRTGHLTALEMPVWNRFTGTRRQRLPRAWLLPPGDSVLVKRLALHGIESARIGVGRRAKTVEYFIPDSIVHDTALFQGHHAERVHGAWRRVTKPTPLAPGSYIVSAAQPLGVLALDLLDPETADGFVTWNLFDGDRGFRPHGRFPVMRIIH